jgi:hypothetical protein
MTFKTLTVYSLCVGVALLAACGGHTAGEAGGTGGTGYYSVDGGSSGWSGGTGGATAGAHRA